jgi:predicted proteasome-type protease
MDLPSKARTAAATFSVGVLIGGQMLGRCPKIWKVVGAGYR